MKMNEFEYEDSVDSSSNNNSTFPSLDTNTKLNDILHTMNKTSKKRSMCHDEDENCYYNSDNSDDLDGANSYQTTNSENQLYKQRKISNNDPSNQEDSEQEAEEGIHVGRLSKSSEDEMFMGLIEHFASLHTTDVHRIEQCPVCTVKIALPEFAAHVKECIQVLDLVEQKQSLELDAYMALKLAEDTGAANIQCIYDKTETNNSNMSDEVKCTTLSDETNNTNNSCPDGIKCTLKNASHFLHYLHPPVVCPICKDTTTPYEINAHLTFCLNQDHPVETETKYDSITGEEIIPNGLNLTESFTDNSSESVKLNSGDSIKLNTYQISSLSREVIKCKTSTDNDSLSDLLDSFKSLGFTMDNLSKLRKDESN